MREIIILMKKVEVFKRVKNEHFLKGLVHGLCPKIELFLMAIFHSNYVTKTTFLDILNRKQSF